MKKRCIFLLLVILIINSVSAGNGVSVEVTPIQDKALIGEEFTFYVTIDNPKNHSDNFRIQIPAIYWDWVAILDPSSVHIGSESEQQTILHLQPYDKSKEPGRYGVELKFFSNNYSDVYTEHTFEVEILTHEQVISTDLELPSSISPDNDNVFRVKVNNNQNFSVNNLTIKLKSDYFEEETEIETLSNEEIEKEFLISLDGPVSEGENEIHTLIYHNGELVIDRIEIVNIGAFGDIKEIGTPEKGFLYYKETVERTNNGNTISYESYTKRLSWFQNLFTDFSNTPTDTERQSGYYIHKWEFTLNPGETRELFIITDYRLFTFAIIVLAGLLIWLYRYFKNDLELTKRIISVQQGKDNIATINVMLTLKNKTMRKVKNVKLVDSMTNVIEQPSNFGSIKPLKSMKTLNGSRLLWEIPIIENGAEMLISYTVKCKSKILGNLFIPRALVKYFRNKRIRIIRSNSTKLFGS